MSEKIYILLPVHNRCAITRRFIESLILQDYTNYHLVLIDDGSTDGTEQMVRSYLNDLTVIKGKGDWWWAGALQQGYLWLKRQGVSVDDVVLIMNDDTEIGPDYLATGLEILRTNPHTLLVTRCYDRQTGKLVDPGTYHMDFAKRAFRTVDGDGEINCSSTRGLFLNVTDFFAIGGFYPILLPHYLSDIEYTYRAHKKRRKLISDKRLIMLLDDEATGFHEHKYDIVPKLLILRQFFSKKSSENPIYWTNFILIACPWKYKAKNIINIWRAATHYLFSHIVFDNNK